MQNLSRGYLIELCDGKADPGILHSARDHIRSGLRGANLNKYSVSYDPKTKTIQVFADINKENFEKILGHIILLSNKKYKIHELNAKQVILDGKQDKIDISTYHAAIYNAAALQDTISGLSSENSRLEEELLVSQEKISELEAKITQVSFAAPLETLIYFLKTREIPKMKQINYDYEIGIIEMFNGEKVPAVQEVAELLESSSIPLEKFRNYGNLKNKMDLIQKEINEAQELSKKLKHVNVKIEPANFDLNSSKQEITKIETEYRNLCQSAQKFREIFKGGDVGGIFFIEANAYASKQIKDFKVLLPIPKKDKYEPIEEFIIDYVNNYFEKPSQDFFGEIFCISGVPKEAKKIDLKGGKKTLKSIGINFNLNLFSTFSIEDIILENKKEPPQKNL